MVFFILIFTLINLYFWIILFPVFSIDKGQRKYIKNHNQRVTVLICARNESRHLQKNLPLILEQDYQNYRLLVIDDASTDDSVSILEQFRQKYNHLHIVRNEKQLGKKQSLHNVISRLDTDVLILTDGDCKANSNQWLNYMLGHLDTDTEFVLGYGPFKKQKGLLNLFARFENFMTALQYFSYALNGKPYMGVGRNLLYRKSTFNKAGGFSDHLKTLSGDDDLLINKMANHQNTSIQYARESFMYSPAPENWSTFFRQKKRHIGASAHYRRIHQLLLGLYSGSHVFFYVFLFLVNWKTGLVFWLTRLVLILSLNVKAFNKLDQKDLIFYFPFLDFMIFPYYCIMALYSILQPKTKNW